MTPLRVVLFGAGSIGALKANSVDPVDGDCPKTHASAITKNPNFMLDAIVDPNLENADAAADKWKVPTFVLTHEEYFDYCEDETRDIYVIASPEKTHLSIIKHICALAVSPKLVICEKPFCSSLQEATEAELILTQKGIPFLVNYSRRFDYGTKRVVAMLHEGTFGQIQRVSVKYNRGLYRDGCHAIDMIQWIAGNIDECGYMQTGIFDYSKEDETGQLFGFTEKGIAFDLIPLDGRFFGIFEIEIFTYSYRIVLSDYGSNLYLIDAKPEQTYSDGKYNSMGYTPDTRTEAMQAPLSDLYIYVAQNVDGKIESSQNALDVWEVIDNVDKTRRSI